MKEHGKPIFTINGKSVGFVKDIHLGNIEPNTISTDLIDFSYIRSGGISSKYAAQKLKEAMNEFNSQNNTKMNKQIIEQIEKIKGVKTVEPHPEIGKVVVTFEASATSVRCTNSEQIDFMQKHFINGVFIGDLPKGINGVSCDFTQYITDYNLTDEWEKYLIGEAERRYPVGTEYKSVGYCEGDRCKIASRFKFFKMSNYEKANIITDGCGGAVYWDGKWAEIIHYEVELVDGEIYAVSDRILRFKKKSTNEGIDVYSQIINCGSFYTNIKSVGYDSIVNELHPATKKQKQKLIKAEVKNGYFHELRSKDSK